MRLGQHRAALPPAQRRRKAFQRGMLAGIAAVAIVAGAVFVALGGGGLLCATREPVLVGVAAAVDVAPAVMEAAGRFNETGTSVGGRCVLVQVTEHPSATVLRTLIGDRAGVLRERPDGWIADSSAWIRLARRRGASALPDPVVALHPREGTINYPYVVTATDPTVAEASAVFARWLKGAQAQEIVRRAGSGQATAAGGRSRPARAPASR
ncbi:hypothetical protein [Nonomuraea cypriaca]|uniref:hypothetical protein n=1 Tax=Nonomuraea cypriaca TaxID=1187855 RepID=UPI002E29617F|nr:hypothetical protein [Nonomuraea cypriaca]